MRDPHGQRPRKALISSDIDVDTPNTARMYDYYLGGNANFAVDRRAADEVLEVMPNLVATMQANRSFLGRAVRYCLARGVRQFLDLGSGIPTVGNVHEIAHDLDPAARVAYVDNEPMTVAHSELMLSGIGNATITQADLREPEAVLSAPGVAGLLDFQQPTALVAVSVLGFVRDDAEVARLLARYTSALAGGGYLAVSHVTLDHHPGGGASAQELYYRTDPPSYARSYGQVAALLSGYDLVAPGLVSPADWHPDGPPPASSGPVACWAGVAQLP